MKKIYTGIIGVAGLALATVIVVKVLSPEKGHAVNTPQRSRAAGQGLFIDAARFNAILRQGRDSYPLMNTICDIDKG